MSEGASFTRNVQKSIHTKPFTSHAMTCQLLKIEYESPNCITVNFRNSRTTKLEKRWYANEFIFNFTLHAHYSCEPQRQTNRNNVSENI